MIRHPAKQHNESVLLSENSTLTVQVEWFGVRVGIVLQSSDQSQIKQVNSRNGFVMMTAPQILS